MKKTKGIKVTYIITPFVVFILALYICIISITVFLNRAINNTISEMDNTAICNRYVSNLQSRNSKLSETCSAFIETPVVPPYGPDVSDTVPREINKTPITEYVEEITDSTKEPSYILDKLKDQNLNKDTVDLIEEAVDSIYAMNEAQYHAIALVKYYVESKGLEDELEAIIGDSIPTYTLTEEELALEDIYILVEARSYISGQGYNSHKMTATEDLRLTLQIINENSSKEQKGLQSNLKSTRIYLWTFMLVIILTNIVFLIIVVKNLVLPIIKFTKKIDENERLDKVSNIYEANHLVDAYNALLDRHKEFENELREVAEIDALTGLPNRYCYNELLKKQSNSDKSVCVFLLDINNLKYVNDKYGHDKGDELIKCASECIKECFLDETNKNCFRIGGDEFVVVLENIIENDIEEYINKFKALQEKKNISVALGYSFTDNISLIGYEKLIIDADTKMYENKNEMKLEMKKVKKTKA